MKSKSVITVLVIVLFAISMSTVVYAKATDYVFVNRI
jgi:hypothetical protein